MRNRRLLREDYLAEADLADRLRRSTRAERPTLLRELYGELKKRAPHHPRFHQPLPPEIIVQRVAAQMRLLRPWLRPNLKVFLEFAPGAGHLAAAMCAHAEQVYAVDISDQLAADLAPPKNFQLMIYDGYNLPLPADSVDMIFSYQLLEHIHPDDVPLHFALAHRLLRAGGCYIFATPHAFSGPHDISRHFSRIPRGLHLKEWTYRELLPLIEQAGFTRWEICRRGIYRPQPAQTTLMLEDWCRKIPLAWRRWLCRRIFAGIVIAAVK